MSSQASLRFSPHPFSTVTAQLKSPDRCRGFLIFALAPRSLLELVTLLVWPSPSFNHVLPTVLYLLRDICRWPALPPDHRSCWQARKRCGPGLFTGQCAETTVAKRLPPPLGQTKVFVGDKGCDSDALRELIESHGGWAGIPPRSNRTNYRWCDPDFCRKRHLVAVLFQQIKYWRCVATRYKNLYFPRLGCCFLRN
jgi:hypothetical protein